MNNSDSLRLILSKELMIIWLMALQKHGAIALSCCQNDKLWEKLPLFRNRNVLHICVPSTGVPHKHAQGSPSIVGPAPAQQAAPT